MVFENNPGFRYKVGTPARAVSSQTWAGCMPSSFGLSSTANYIYSIYADYTPDEQDQSPELIGNPYMFTGRRFDLETGLYYYRARYYNPQIGRFLQTDPIGYDYAYCGNNPIGFVDPSGMIMESYDWSGLASNMGYGEGIDGSDATSPDENVTFIISIPMDYVWDYDGWNDEWFTPAYCLEQVQAFLDQTGFSDECLGMQLISVERIGDYYEVKFRIADACNTDVKIDLGILGEETPEPEGLEVDFEPYEPIFFYGGQRGLQRPGGDDELYRLSEKELKELSKRLKFFRNKGARKRIRDIDRVLKHRRKKHSGLSGDTKKIVLIGAGVVIVVGTTVYIIGSGG